MANGAQKLIVWNETMRTVSGELGSCVPDHPKFKIGVVDLFEQLMQPEVIVSLRAVLPICFNALEPLIDDIQLLVGNQEPTGQHAVWPGSIKCEKSGRCRLMKPLVEGPKTIGRAVYPDAAVSAEKRQSNNIAQSVPWQIFLKDPV